MQDRVQEVLKSLENEWCLGERLSLRDGLEAMMRRKNQDTREIRETGRYGDVEEYLRQERGSWVSPTYEEVMEQIRLFSDEDQARFLSELDESIKREIEHEPMQRIENSQPRFAKEDSEPLYNVMDFEGIGHKTWDAVGGVDEFIKQARASWDD